VRWALFSSCDAGPLAYALADEAAFAAFEELASQASTYHLANDLRESLEPFDLAVPAHSVAAAVS
jgi:hypothetical protein